MSVSTKAAALTGLALASATLAGALALAEEDAAAPASPKAPHRRWQDVPQPPLERVADPKPVRARLPNGTRLFLLEDHELPTIELTMIVHAGEMDLPRLYPAPGAARAKAGLASLAGQLMRSGGAGSRTADELDEALDAMAASVDTSCGDQQGSARLSCLKESFDPALAIFADVVLRPAFREEKVALAKRQRAGSLRRRNENPAQIASREMARLMYGDVHPLGWTDEPETIDSIERDDIVGFYKASFAASPQTALIGVVGDFDAKAMQEKLAAALGDTAPGKASDGAAGGDVQVGGFAGPGPKVYFARKTDVNQATVLMAHPGIQRKPGDPDYPAAVIANSILGGGGFAGRLMQRVRTEMGLAYGCRSTLDAAYGHQGLFQMQGQTKSGSTLAMARAMRKELERIGAEPPTAEELKVAKDGILERLVFESDQKRDVLERALRYEFHGFPENDLENFQKGIAAVTAEDCLRVAKALFRPGQLTTLVVGNDAEFDGKLAELGEVTPIELKEPGRRGGRRGGSGEVR